MTDHYDVLETRMPQEREADLFARLPDVLRAAMKADVATFINVSTDKAANPTSVLGRSKRIAERLTAWAAAETGRPYLSVRFGNVLGSRGSMLPVFTSMIEAGGPLTITHPDVTRYFMTIPEACQLVMQAGAIGEPGEVLILDMGEPIRTADLAPRPTTVDRTLFQSNKARKGGALYVQNAKPLVIEASTFAANSATGAGAAQLVGDRLELTNTTFAGNLATEGLGGALVLSGSDPAGFIRNATFSGNQSSGGPGYFSAAIFGTLDFPVHNTVFANDLSRDAGSSSKSKDSNAKDSGAKDSSGKAAGLEPAPSPSSSAPADGKVPALPESSNFPLTPGNAPPPSATPTPPPK